MRTSSPSIYGRSNSFARTLATEDLPQPAGPVMIQIWRAGLGLGREFTVPMVWSEVEDEGEATKLPTESYFVDIMIARA
jgi:hypothetical protein